MLGMETETSTHAKNKGVIECNDVQHDSNPLVLRRGLLLPYSQQMIAFFIFNMRQENQPPEKNNILDFVPI